MLDSLNPSIADQFTALGVRRYLDGDVAGSQRMVAASETLRWRADEDTPDADKLIELCESVTRIDDILTQDTRDLEKIRKRYRALKSPPASDDGVAEARYIDDLNEIIAELMNDRVELAYQISEALAD